VTKIAFVFLILATAILSQQVEPFTPGEGLAIEIYDEVLPLLIAAEPLIEDIEDIEVDFDDIIAVAEENEIEIEPIREAILSDPYMARWTVTKLKVYSEDNLGLAKGAKEPELKSAHIKAGTEALKHAHILETLIDSWAPEEE